jgi:hypothetical protein
LRSGAGREIVAGMAFRRELLAAALAVALLLVALPAVALAAPQFVPAETLDAADAGTDVTADPQGDSAAIWVELGVVRVAERPRGGPWGDAVDLDRGADAGAPKIAALPDGELVAMWVKAGQVMAAQRPPGGAWTTPVPVSATCCLQLLDVVAGADGTAMGLWYSGDGPSQTSTLPPGSDTWGPPQDIPNGSPDMSLAVARDGGAEIVSASGSCGPGFNLPCIRAQHRPPGGAWADDATQPAVTGNVTGNALVAEPDGHYTLLWGQDAGGLARSQVPNGTVVSSDRGPGAGGAWDASPAVVSRPGGEAPGCPTASGGCMDLAVAGDGRLSAVWQQGNGDGRTANHVRSALRSPAGAWEVARTIEDVPARDALPRTAFTGNGIPVAVWRVGGGGPGTAIRGAHRDATANWVREAINAPATLDAAVDFEDVVGDGEGNAITGWRDQHGAGVAGFDGIGPSFTTFLPPASGQAGQTLGFSAAASDNWSGVAGISWLFGDGGTADGASASHAYGAPGSYTATATAADGAGNTTQRSADASIASPPGPPVGDCGSTDRDHDGVFDGCDVSDGSAPPTPFKTLNATVVSGDVFVKLPAGAARAAAVRAHAAAGAKPPKGFVRLQGAQTIPMGSTLDTAKGKVRLRTAKDTRRHTETGVFNAGRFVVRQSRLRRGSRKLITDLRLTGSSFAKACATAKKASISRRRSRKRVRRLFGDGKGNFRTRGRNAAATVRGTRWGVQDRCDGTLVTVRRGRVAVRDLVRHRTVLVRAGHTYLARRR